METINNTLLNLGTSIVNGIINGFTSLLKSLFIPSDNFFSEKIKPIEEKFGFVSQIVNLAKTVIDMCNNADVTPPSFTVDLSSSNFSWDIGDSVTFDFSWYAPYRDTVNAWLSGFMWLGFIWNTFRGLPGIINGAGAVVSTGTSGGD